MFCIGLDNECSSAISLDFMKKNCVFVPWGIEMTAEIAVLNKLAVTLAADSAVTIQNSDGTKVYNSADKIFEATTYDPIGIMVYNKPEVCDVPIEVIVKMFRDHDCPGHFSTVFDFAKAFLSHIEAYDTPDQTVNNTIWGMISSKLFSLRNMVREQTEEFYKTASAEKYASVEELLADLEAVVLNSLNDQIVSLENSELPSWANGLSLKDVIDHHGEKIKDLVDMAFDGDDQSEERKARVVSILALSLLKEFQRGSLTGLVFAGFGQDEKFPSLVSFEVYGTIAGKLKHTEQVKFDVDRKLLPDAAAFPFAQKEMVDRFMYGLDSEFLELCTSYFSGALNSLKNHLRERIDEMDDATGEALDQSVDAILAEFEGQIISDHVNLLQRQFSDMIRSMPKQELAALAESLVHITSLKRKFSAGAESVGGPIDVAMITRAEGFVWVKRKHYFDASLNPRYFHRRYGGNHHGTSSVDSGEQGEA